MHTVPKNSSLHVIEPNRDAKKPCEEGLMVDVQSSYVIGLRPLGA